MPPPPPPPQPQPQREVVDLTGDDDVPAAPQQLSGSATQLQPQPQPPPQPQPQPQQEMNPLQQPPPPQLRAADDGVVLNADGKVVIVSEQPQPQPQPQPQSQPAQQPHPQPQPQPQSPPAPPPPRPPPQSQPQPQPQPQPQLQPPRQPQRLQQNTMAHGSTSTAVQELQRRAVDRLTRMLVLASRERHETYLQRRSGTRAIMLGQTKPIRNNSAHIAICNFVRRKQKSEDSTGAERATPAATGDRSGVPAAVAGVADWRTQR